MQKDFSEKEYLKFILNIPYNVEILKEIEKSKPKRRGRKKQKIEYLLKFKKIDEHIPLAKRDMEYFEYSLFSLETDYYDSIPLIDVEEEMLIK